jgi:hypothetical protein
VFGVEAIDVGEEAAVPRVALADPVRIGVVEIVEIPAAIGGERRDGVAAGGDELPEVLGVAPAVASAVAPRSSASRAPIAAGVG